MTQICEKGVYWVTKPVNLYTNRNVGLISAENWRRKVNQKATYASFTKGVKKTNGKARKRFHRTINQIQDEHGEGFQPKDTM